MQSVFLRAHKRKINGDLADGEVLASHSDPYFVLSSWRLNQHVRFQSEAQLIRADLVGFDYVFNIAVQ